MEREILLQLFVQGLYGPALTINLRDILHGEVKIVGEQCNRLLFFPNISTLRELCAKSPRVKRTFWSMWETRPLGLILNVSTSPKFILSKKFYRTAIIKNSRTKQINYTTLNILVKAFN